MAASRDGPEPTAEAELLDAEFDLLRPVASAPRLCRSMARAAKAVWLARQARQASQASQA